MSTLSRIAAIVILIFALPRTFARAETATSPASSPNRGRVVMVASFENKSGIKAHTSYEVDTGNDERRPSRSFQIDRYSEAPRSILEDILTRVDGVTVVERKRVDSMLLEGEFGRSSGLVDQDTALRLGKMFGANTLVVGEVLSVKTKEKQFQGYGVRTKNVIVTASIRVRIMDGETAAISGSKIFEGERTYASSSFGGTTNSDVAQEVIEDALKKVELDDAFLAKLSGPKARKLEGVEVTLAPRPENCDVVIDGVYRGSSPMTVTLPAGKQVSVQFRKAGRRTWESMIAPAENLRVTPELEPAGATAVAATTQP